MNLDILNDVLNRTISNLFTNRQKHIAYMSYDEDDEYSSDPSSQIQPSSTYHKKQVSKKQPESNAPSANIHKPQARQNQVQQPQVYVQKKTEEGKITPEIWKNSIAKKKLEESMKKLGVDEQKIKSKFYINFSLEQLNHEKSRVKNELKKYDADFMEIFKVAPNKEEKEIMKPLYVYYKSLKNCIMKKEQEKGKAKDNSSFTDYQTNTYNSNANNSNYTDLNDYSALSNVNNYSGISEARQPHKKAYSANPRDNVDISDLGEPKIEKKRSYSRAEINDIEKKYNTIRKEQGELKEMLHKYQDDFLQANNRKVKYLRDIAPVEKEYNMYKANKKKIKEIQDILKEAMKK